MADDNSSKRPSTPAQASRRGFLKAGGAALAAGATLGVGLADAAQPAHSASVNVQREAAQPGATVPFYGLHQAGIITPQQRHTYLIGLDLTTDKRSDLLALLHAWTDAAARMTRGEPAAALTVQEDQPPPDSAEALGLGAERLTLTFGFGPGVFTQNGHDRYGLAARRPAALVDLPRFNGDQLRPEKSGGDLFLQACSEDAQVAFHAARQLARLADGIAHVHWGQAGFLSGPRGQTPRNLMGFKDGTNNPSTRVPAQMNDFVWAEGDAAAPWMRGGTYTVIRRIRITLEHWDKMELGFQEQVFGRHKYSGAPLGKQAEFDPLDLAALDKDGNPIVPESAHVRLSNQATNNGAQILRRSYSYNDGTDFYIERWPPWRQETEYDAGLIFIAHQRDPRTGFIPINDRLAKFDLMNQFTTHVGSAIFACPPGVTEGSFIGAGLFES